MHLYNRFETLLTERVAGVGAAGLPAGAEESKLSEEEFQELAKGRLADTTHVEAMTRQALRQLSEHAVAWELPQRAGAGWRGVKD